MNYKGIWYIAQVSYPYRSISVWLRKQRCYTYNLWHVQSIFCWSSSLMLAAHPVLLISNAMCLISVVMCLISDVMYLISDMKWWRTWHLLWCTWYLLWIFTEMGDNRRMPQVRTARPVICRVLLLDGKQFEIDVDVSFNSWICLDILSTFCKKRKIQDIRNT